MANFNNLSLTSSGVKALLEAQAGKTLTLSKIGLGSGSTTSGIVSLKALVTPELMIPISETIIDSTEGYMTVVAKMTNENMTEGFYWKETGLFFKDDNDEDILFAYACITDDKYDYIPAFSDQRYVKNIRIANIVTDTDNITVEESEGLMYVDTVTFNAFKDEVVKYNDVVDNLLSESDNLPLSAKQGKVLKEGVDQLNSDLTGLYSGLDNKQDKTKYSDMCRVMSLVTLANDDGFQITYPENISLNLLIITKACTAIITKIAGAAATVSEIIGSFSKKSSTTTVTFLRTGAGQRALIIFASSNPPSVIVSTYKA